VHAAIDAIPTARRDALAPRWKSREVSGGRGRDERTANHPRHHTFPPSNGSPCLSLRSPSHVSPRFPKNQRFRNAPPAKWWAPILSSFVGLAILAAAAVRGRRSQDHPGRRQCGALGVLVRDDAHVLDTRVRETLDRAYRPELYNSFLMGAGWRIG